LWEKDLKTLKVRRGRPQTPSKIHRVGESHFSPDHSRPESSGNHLLRVLVWVSFNFRKGFILFWFVGPGRDAGSRKKFKAASEFDSQHDFVALLDLKWGV
jgi:hypothetical protein